MKSIIENAQHLSKRIVDTGKFMMLEAKTILPIVTFQLLGDEAFTAFDISDSMREKGWIVAAYNLPAHAENVSLLRVVVRENFSHDISGLFIKDLLKAHDNLSKNEKKSTGHSPVDLIKSSINVC